MNHNKIDDIVWETDIIHKLANIDWKYTLWVDGNRNQKIWADAEKKTKKNTERITQGQLVIENQRWRYGDNGRQVVYGYIQA